MCRSLCLLTLLYEDSHQEPVLMYLVRILFQFIIIGKYVQLIIVGIMF